jgi:hypothetical protein
LAILLLSHRQWTLLRLLRNPRMPGD